jgi:hypothetical protein
MLLCYDNLDIESWMDERAWADLNPDGGRAEDDDSEDESVVDEDYNQMMEEALQPFIVNDNCNLADVIPIQPPVYNLREEEELNEELRNNSAIVIRQGIETVQFFSRDSLRKALVYHFSMRYYRGLLRWPKNMKSFLKQILPIQGRGIDNDRRNKALEIMERAREEDERLQDLRRGTVSRFVLNIYYKWKI